MEKKVAIVTGAGQGLGEAIAKRLARDGFSVVVAEYSEIQGSRVTDEIRAKGGDALAVVTDVADRNSVREMVKRVINTFGRIDGLVNNAGIYPKSPIVRMEKREWDRVLAVNLRGAFLCSKYVLPVMMERRRGRIVNLSSGHAFRGGAEFSHYSASKAGLVALTKSLALEVARYGILVNTVAPGISDTPMPRIHSSEEEVRQKAEKMPMGRLVKPEEVADAVSYLLSERNTFITGQLIGVNGGQVLYG